MSDPPHRAAALGLLWLVVLGLVGPVGSSVSAEPLKGDRELGAYLSSECVTCHQVSGRSDGIPPIVGWPEDIFVEVMNQYRQRKRANALMQTIAARLSDEELAALAAYFGSLMPK